MTEERSPAMPVTVHHGNALPPQATLPPRPAVLEPPDEVRDAIAREEARLQGLGIAVSPEAHKRMLDDWSLSYYFRDLEGVDIAYRPTERGVEILGVGFEEVMKVRRTLGDGEGSAIRYREV
jgi:hypothetical protein